MGGIAMRGSRQKVLERVRHAVKEGNRAGHAPPLPARGDVGYQGSGPDTAARFCDECAAAGGNVHRAANTETAIACVLNLVQAKAARRVLLGHESILEELGLVER